MASEFPPASLKPVIAEVVELLTSRKETVAVAETAAGGIISASLLATPGASGFYKGGLTLYTLPSRVAFAGWTQDSIANYTGPTPAIVSGLAENVRGTLESTYVVCESGTAGPTNPKAGSGKTRNRTPGYVALAVAGPQGTVTREIDTGHGRREENMVEFAKEALGLLRDAIKGEAKL